MNDPRWKRKEERFPGLELWETTVIVNRRTAVFVTRDRDPWSPPKMDEGKLVFVARDRQGETSTFREFSKRRSK
jgi:hypothetical protein